MGKEETRAERARARRDKSSPFSRDTYKNIHPTYRAKGLAHHLHIVHTRPTRAQIDLYSHIARFMRLKLIALLTRRARSNKSLTF